MNRLHIISRDENTAGGLVCQELYLSSSQYSVISNVETAMDLPAGLIVLNDYTNPDSVKISEILTSKNCTILTLPQLKRMIDNITTGLDNMSQMYGSFTSSQSTESGIAKLTNYFNSLNFTKENGFEYKIVRSTSSHAFGFIASSPKMEVIYNLCIAHSLRVSNMSYFN